MSLGHHGMQGHKMEYVHDHGLTLWCPKRDQRIYVVICLHRKCKHLKENGNEGLFKCVFESSLEKKILSRKKDE